MQKGIITLLVLVFSVTQSLIGCHLDPYPKDRLSEAEKLAAQNRFDEAIKLYQEHMKERLNVENRPEWENPYFYLLLIGDLYLKKGDIEAAIKAYTEAEKNGVSKDLISDRVRIVAKWYEDKGEFKKGIEFLKDYREKDPLLIDSVLDRLARSYVSSTPRSEHATPTQEDNKN